MSANPPMTTLERAALYVSKCEGAREGHDGNAVTFAVAGALVWGFELSPSEAMPIMLQYNARCEPPWSQRELLRMLNSPTHQRSQKRRGYLLGIGEHIKGLVMEVEPEKPKRTRAKYSLETLQKLQDKSLPQTMTEWREWLRDRSPTDPRTVTPETYLDSLYRKGERVMVFDTMRSTGNWVREIGVQNWKLGQYPTDKNQPTEELMKGSAEGMNFLMQPVTGGWRYKANSTEMSRRVSNCVTRWPYALLESDKAPPELWLNVLVRVRLRIVSITASGGRSYHAVVHLDKETEDELRDEIDHPDVRETLEVIGCDPQAFHTMVYPRLPNTFRDGKMMGVMDPATGKVKRDSKGRVVMKFTPFSTGRATQSLLYFNPDIEPGQYIAGGTVFEHEDR